MVIQETTPTSSSHKDNIVRLVKAWLTSAGTITVNQYNIAMSLPQKLHLMMKPGDKIILEEAPVLVTIGKIVLEEAPAFA